MNNFIQWGLRYHNLIRNEHTTSLVRISHIGGTLIVPATIIDPESYINVNGVRTKTQHYICMLDGIDAAKIRWNRSTTIERLDDDEQVVAKYEVIIDKLTQDEYDDPEHNTKNVPCTLLI